MSIKQMLFDKSLAQIVKQGGPSVDEHGSCVYRGKGGCGCGAAPFILKYVSDMESLSWDEVVEDWRDNLMPEAIEEWLLVCNLQAAHDTAARTEREGMRFMPDYFFRMSKIADEHGLKFEEPVT